MSRTAIGDGQLPTGQSYGSFSTLRLPPDLSPSPRVCCQSTSHIAIAFTVTKPSTFVTNARLADGVLIGVGGPALWGHWTHDSAVWGRLQLRLHCSFGDCSCIQ